VRTHPWFTVRLPRYLAVMQADPAMTQPRIDNEIVAEVGAPRGVGWGGGGGVRWPAVTQSCPAMTRPRTGKGIAAEGLKAVVAEAGCGRLAGGVGGAALCCGPAPALLRAHRSPPAHSRPTRQAVRLGFDQEALLESLRARQQNKATVTYYLLSDNRRHAVSNNYLSGEMQEAPPSTLALGGAHFGMSLGFGTPPAGLGQGHVPRAAGALGLSHPSASGSAGGGAPAGRVSAAERRWRLGVAARGHPSALMAELFRSLQVGWGGAVMGGAA
jgi:hypothetical protein